MAKVAEMEMSSMLTTKAANAGNERNKKDEGEGVG
ncbi:hypothetical protein GYH30_015691 [Glycine max]|nr:hypothetical protein GYH30_015691 [Glycine max]